MKYLLVLCIFYLNSFSDVIILNKDEELSIRQKTNKKQIINRFNRYYNFLSQAQTFDIDKKLIRTNLHINRIIPKFDKKGSNTWSFPKEFLINGYGDCEDYALTKYFSLDYLGISRKNLYLAVVKVKSALSYHMVLLYFDKKNVPLVLDNLSWKVLPLKEREDLEVQFVFNDKASYIIEENILIKEVGIRRGEVSLFKRMLLENQ